MRLREIVETLERRGMLKTVREPLSSEEVAPITMALESRYVLMFESVDGKRIPVLTNLCGLRGLVKELLGCRTDEELYSRLIEACGNPMPCRRVGLEKAAFARRTLSSLHDLPIIKYFPKDPGPYITAGVVMARGPASGVCNASFHRMLLIGDRRMVARVVPRHLWMLYREAIDHGEELKVAIAIGLHPAVLIAAACSPPFGVYEIEVANRLLDGRLEVVELPSGIPVPKDAEIVIEGRMLAEKAPEGPFVDITGTYDTVREQPVIEVDRIWVAEDAIYHAIVPSGAEHRLLMGLYREAAIWDAVRRVVPKVHKVRLTKGGCGWLHAAISITKGTEGDAKNAILAAFAAHPSLKMVIVVDEDVDVDDPNQVEWALATRFQASEDLVIIRRARGSSLDPSADQHSLLTDKVGIDATRPLNKPREHFERAPMLESPRVRELIRKLLGGEA